MNSLKRILGAVGVTVLCGACTWALNTAASQGPPQEPRGRTDVFHPLPPGQGGHLFQGHSETPERVQAHTQEDDTSRESEPQTPPAEVEAFVQEHIAAVLSGTYRNKEKEKEPELGTIIEHGEEILILAGGRLFIVNQDGQMLLPGSDVSVTCEPCGNMLVCVLLWGGQVRVLVFECQARCRLVFDSGWFRERQQGGDWLTEIRASIWDMVYTVYGIDIFDLLYSVDLSEGEGTTATPCDEGSQEPIHPLP